VTRATPGSCKRRIYDAMVSFADQVIGNVSEAIRSKGMWEHALVVFASDNGGPHEGPMDNFPLRGGKFSDMEGGVRVPALVAGGLVPLQRRGVKLEGEHAYVHISDWFATFLAVARAPLAPSHPETDASGTALPPSDGLDVWPFLSGEVGYSPRVEMPLTMGFHQPPPGPGGGSIIVGRFKLMLGTQRPAGHTTRAHAHLVSTNTSSNRRPPNQAMHCSLVGCLFDIIADPFEERDLAPAAGATHLSIMARLRERLSHFDASSFQTCWTIRKDSKGRDITKPNCSTPWAQARAQSGVLGAFTDKHCVDSGHTLGQRWARRRSDAITTQSSLRARDARAATARLKIGGGARRRFIGGRRSGGANNSSSDWSNVVAARKRNANAPTFQLAGAHQGSSKSTIRSGHSHATARRL